MSFVDIDQRRTSSMDDESKVVTYRVHTGVLRAVGIDSNLFVYSVLDDTFQYVAALYDLLKWPADKNEARAQTLDYYRKPNVDLDFTDPVTATDAAADHLRRLTLVVKDWDRRPSSFPGETIVTIQGLTNV